jgi:hypothetical protein
MASVERDYPAAWRDYRRRSFLALGSIVASFPGGLLIGLALSARLGPDAPMFVAAALTLAIVLPCSFRLAAWRCPRCGKPFHGPLGWAEPVKYSNPFARQCDACGLPRQEPGPGVWSRH